jgi:hypothetical protein
VQAEAVESCQRGFIAFVLSSAVLEEVMNKRKSLVACIVFTGILSASAAMAQESRRVGPPVPCPHPITITINGGSTPPTPDPADFGAGANVIGSVWNQTATDKHFGHTFHFPAPGRECCIMTSGTLRVTVKALQGGPKGSPTSANDSINVMSSGVNFGQQQPWLNGVATGATTTLTFTIPPNILAKGQFSLYVQDDTAVVSAQLILSGCCLK